MTSLSNRPARPRRFRRSPSYPRMGALAMVVACAGVLTACDGEVVAPTEESASSSSSGWGGGPAGDIEVPFGGGGTGGQISTSTGWGGAPGGIPEPFGGGGTTAVGGQGGGGAGQGGAAQGGYGGNIAGGMGDSFE